MNLDPAWVINHTCSIIIINNYYIKQEKQHLKNIHYSALKPQSLGGPTGLLTGHCAPNK